MFRPGRKTIGRRSSGASNSACYSHSRLWSRHHYGANIFTYHWRGYNFCSFGFGCFCSSGGKKVYIFSSKDNISHELKTGGNGYFDLKDIHEIWGKDLKYREKDKNKTTLN